MITQAHERSRWLLAALAVSGWSGLGLQLPCTLSLARSHGGTIAGGLAVYFGYFNVLTNLIVAMAASSRLCFPGSRGAVFARRPSVASGICASILLVSIAYNVLLRNLVHPRGLEWLADMLLHDLTPVAFAAYWWRTVPRGSIGWRDAPGWLILPVAYLIFVLLRGATSGWYPYPFLDAAALGYGRVAVNAAVLLMLMLGLSAFLIGLKRESAIAAKSAAEADRAALAAPVRTG